MAWNPPEQFAFRRNRLNEGKLLKIQDPERNFVSLETKRAPRLNWWAKLAICVVWDGLDFTVGRTLFPVPFVGELAGTALASALFGKAGLFYLAEALDVSEQVDGFAPTATLIALANRDKTVEVQPAANLSQR